MWPRSTIYLKMDIKQSYKKFKQVTPEMRAELKKLSKDTMTIEVLEDHNGAKKGDKATISVLTGQKLIEMGKAKEVKPSPAKKTLSKDE